jgi:ribosomal protein S12 methylthiotransferase accessory factor
MRRKRDSSAGPAPRGRGEAAARPEQAGRGTARRTRGGALAEALGVTRVARVTALDRSGVEVACAVRPGGHVLQVTNGKGETAAAAARGALCEAAELWAAERVDAASLRGGPDGLAYLAARDLVGGHPVMVPAAAVHCPPAGGPLLGDPGIPWTSSGMGAHERWEAAALHALLEAVERDQLARALPDGFTAGAVRARLVAREALAREAPRAARIAARIEARGFDVFFLDASGPIALPVAAALLFDGQRGPVPLAAGYACRPTADEALAAALLEAAQSRLTDVHGAREDAAPMDPADVEALYAMCARARPRRSAGAMARVDAPARLRAVLARLQRAGFDRAAAVDLAPAGFPLRVAKVLVPGFTVSGLL